RVEGRPGDSGGLGDLHEVGVGVVLELCDGGVEDRGDVSFGDPVAQLVGAVGRLPGCRCTTLGAGAHAVTSAGGTAVAAVSALPLSSATAAMRDARRATAAASR